MLFQSIIVALFSASVLATPFKTETRNVARSGSANQPRHVSNFPASSVRNGVRSFNQAERRSAYDQARRNRHARRDLAIITTITTALQEVNQNLGPLLSALNTTVAAATATNVPATIDSLNGDLTAILNLLNGLIKALTAPPTPAPSPAPGPAPPASDCAATKAIAAILAQITNSVSPTLKNVQNLITANPALAPVSPLLVSVQAALATVVPTVNTIITETLGLVCTILGQTGELVTSLPGAVPVLAPLAPVTSIAGSALTQLTQ